MSDKLEDQELKKLQELNNKIGACRHDIGILEVQKSEVLGLHGEALKEFNVFKDELNKKYGSIEVDLATGKITEKKEDGKEKTS
jgi:hypothetical protein